MTEKIERLRRLRARVDRLGQSVASDLKVFLHQKDLLTFRRKPDSQSLEDDVNVTTSCSCIMALALTNQFSEFYDCKTSNSIESKAQSILTRLVDAPWMSSGLTANNAFTTSLVIRTYGFLREFQLLTKECDRQKEWDLELRLTDVASLSQELKRESSELMRFLYRSLTDDTRHLFTDLSSAGDE